MKGPLDDELDAGGTISSVPYPQVLKDSKKTGGVENVRRLTGRRIAERGEDESL
jgi:hypothetical protein